MKTMRCGMKLFHEKVAGKFPKAKFLANLKTILGLVLVALLASGCGDNGGGGGYSDVLEGTFVDSPVEGLEYQTETQSGMTDENGAFVYMDGEIVTFHVGDIVLGEAIGHSMMTPVDLVDGAMDETHPMVTNMARLLQTLDADMDPDNGITITEQMAAATFDHTIDFNMDPGTFEHDPNVQMFMDTLNGLDPSSPVRMMVSAEDAQNHLHNTLSHMMSGDSGIMDDDDTIKGDMIPENSDMMTYDTGMMSLGSGMMR